MIKLSAGYSKKLPVEGVDFSSRQYSAHIEVEVADQAAGEVISKRLHVLYDQLQEAVDQRLAQDQNQPSKTNNEYTPEAVRNRSGGNRRTKSGSATEAQQRAIFAVSKAVGMSAVGLKEMMVEVCGVTDPVHLTKEEASQLIDLLKARGSVPAGS